jgi:hypothetical protein
MNEMGMHNFRKKSGVERSIDQNRAFLEGVKRNREKKSPTVINVAPTPGYTPVHNELPKQLQDGRNNIVDFPGRYEEVSPHRTELVSAKKDSVQSYSVQAAHQVPMAEYVVSEALQPASAESRELSEIDMLFEIAKKGEAMVDGINPFSDEDIQVITSQQFKNFLDFLGRQTSLSPDVEHVLNKLDKALLKATLLLNMPKKNQVISTRMNIGSVLKKFARPAMMSNYAPGKNLDSINY